MKFGFVRGAFLRNIFHNQNDYFTELKRTSKFKGFLKTTDQTTTDQMHLPRTNRLLTRKKFEDQKNFEFMFWIKYDFQTKNTEYLQLYSASCTHRRLGIS